MTADLTRRPGLRGLFLFTNFFLILLAYYLIKPASRSVFLDHFTAEQLPYAWIASALVLAVMMPFYTRLVGAVDRRRMVVSSCALFAVVLTIFGMLLNSDGSLNSSAIEAGIFYVFVDIMSVVLIEQFWSITNSAFASDTGSRWYGLVGSGGLAGSLVGGQMASWLIKSTPLQTPDLLFVSAGVIALIAVFCGVLSRVGLYAEQEVGMRPKGLQKPLNFARLLKNRYLMLIAATVLFAQLIEPIVEYQFSSYVQDAFPDRETRTAFLSNFLSLLAAVGLGINLLLTPIILRYAGAVGGMLLQPILVAASSGAYMAHAGLTTVGAMKLSDRSLSYSINRAAKEMLYVPVDARLIYRAKAWIDMLGYRLFKVIGSLTILILTQWTALNWAPGAFTFLVIPICAIWMLTTIALRSEYLALREAEMARREEQQKAGQPEPIAA